VIYFSGFSLSGENEIFKDFLVDTEFSVAGFSYGAIKAFEYALDNHRRVDRLTLLSPAFFQDKNEAFKRAQLRYFKLNRELYIKNFLENIAYPSKVDLTQYLDIGTYSQLESLLNYRWDIEKLKKLKSRGVIVEIFLGKSDRIIDSKKALNLFSKITTTYYINGRGHILI
jgi:pimeloyl-ACP methyl ester carboxylesterase